MQHVKPESGVQLVIAGAAGAQLYEVEEHHPRAWFARSAPGFAVLDIARSSLALTFVDHSAQPIYRQVLASKPERQR